MGALSGKVAWVTGSSRGIGAGIARSFARAGARVAVHGRDAAAVDGVLGELRENGEGMAVIGDGTKLAQVERMRTEVEAKLGPVEVLVVNAGDVLTLDVAAQVGPNGICVNCIAPETILTERNRERIPDAQKAELVEHHPIRRLGTPDDVARAEVFLASDESAWITGTILDVAGGSVLAT
jgi:NAD(P)-dependent dehydrogenase (short-subunit alcohol dehydrogenase family)